MTTSSRYHIQDYSVWDSNQDQHSLDNMQGSSPPHRQVGRSRSRPQKQSRWSHHCWTSSWGAPSTLQRVENHKSWLPRLGSHFHWVDFSYFHLLPVIWGREYVLPQWEVAFICGVEGISNDGLPIGTAGPNPHEGLSRPSPDISPSVVTIKGIEKTKGRLKGFSQPRRVGCRI